MKRLLKITFTLIFTTILLLGFAMPLNPVGNWYQQFLPNIGSRTIQDVFFIDSLTGWAVTNATNQNPDTIFVLKTTNRGDSWAMQYIKTQTGGGFSGYFKIYFLNQNTGYTCDVLGVYKTTNGGLNWASLNAPLNAYTDMSVLNTDTIWTVTPDGFAGGVFFTSTGGASWQNRLSLGSQNPIKVYFFNGSTGYVAKNTGSTYVRQTTDSGASWNILFNSEGFTDMYFANSLTGWKAFGTMKKTTDGGLNWVNQTLPGGGNIIVTSMDKFTNVNSDTIWGVGGYINTGSGARGMIYRTTNGGSNWLFQVPDSNINIFKYFHIKFVNRLNGWAYNPLTGVHTILGGDTIWLTSIKQISGEVPTDYKLYQNYPNPFNPTTNITFEVTRNSKISLKIFNILGEEIDELIDYEDHNTGTYTINFEADDDIPSGVYFYQITAWTENKKEIFIDTKKMILLK